MFGVWTPVDRSGATGTLLPARLESVSSPRTASEQTLRLCRTDADAIAASIVISGLTYREIAARMGVSKSIVNAWAHGQRSMPNKRVRAFCNATGTLFLQQFLAFERALRAAQGKVRERDRIAEIAAPSMRAA